MPLQLSFLIAWAADLNHSEPAFAFQLEFDFNLIRLITKMDTETEDMLLTEYSNSH